ncbi:parathymosin-like [Bufo gargarizans]|uniref:parathymosin-like n=1 Tax=Bufo gargarizans TaxID=30331 RepID=UPI001CF58F58|nr:parathymosin-like [Bufo gargarizans]
MSNTLCPGQAVPKVKICKPKQVVEEEPDDSMEEEEEVVEEPEDSMEEEEELVEEQVDPERPGPSHDVAVTVAVEAEEAGPSHTQDSDPP